MFHSSDPKPQKTPSSQGLHIHHHSLSSTYLVKRGLKHFYCNFHPLGAPAQTKSDPKVTRSLQKAKYLRKLQNLQSIVPYKQYTRLLKRHNLSVNTYQVLNSLNGKNKATVKHLVKKFKQIKRFNIKFSMPLSVTIRYFNKITNLTISTQISSETPWRELIIKTFRKAARRLTRLTKLQVITGETYRDRELAAQVFEISKKMVSLKEINIHFQHLTLGKYEPVNVFDLSGINSNLIVSLYSIPHPVFLSNLLSSHSVLINLKKLTFRLPLLADQRFQDFDFKTLECLQQFQNLQSLGISLELSDSSYESFVEYMRFPPCLKKLSFGLEGLNLKKILEKKKDCLKAFLKSFISLKLEELILSVLVSQHYSATYCEFIRPLVVYQKQLKNLNLKYSFSSPLQKSIEKKYLHMMEVFNDIQHLGSLRKLEVNFEILDFTAKVGTGTKPFKPLKNTELTDASIIIQEIVWQEPASRGFIEEMLKYLGECKNIKNLLLQSRGNKEMENVKKGLRAVLQFEKLEKVHVDWNVESLKMEELCNFFEEVKRPLVVIFGLRQILFTRDELDAIINSLRKSRALIEAKVCGVQCDVLKYGRDGAPYEFAGNTKKRP